MKFDEEKAENQMYREGYEDGKKDGKFIGHLKGIEAVLKKLRVNIDVNSQGQN